MQERTLHFGILGVNAAAARDDDDIDTVPELVRIESVYLLNLRRTRLRTTALPSLVDTVYPTRRRPRGALRAYTTI